jgi:lipopolysaccharide export system protein LptA
MPQHQGIIMRRIITLRALVSFFPAVFVSLLICYPLTHAANETNARKQPPNMNEKLVNSKSPIHITADRMETNQDERTIIFESHVVAQQDDVTITSNRLKVTLLPGEKKPASAGTTATERIDYIEFEGDVKVTQQDRLATANKAIFYQKEQKIILHGRPVVTKGQDRIEGDLITIYLKEGRSVVEGGGGAPVQAVLFPEKKE